ncbi:MAG TPA: DUF192 domain-containing protein [Actinomycetota bacterium]|nr:DUF192 domain-containing protein [Actinomycetota bacterium]
MYLFDPDNPWIRVEVWQPLGLFGRARGLLGCLEVGRGRGFMLRAKQVHTIGMAFPIDVIHISRKGVVIRVRTQQPGRVGRFVLGARWVLEMDAGEAERLGIRVGGRLVPQRLPAASMCAPPR